jgi:hypothetical protein
MALISPATIVEKKFSPVPPNQSHDGPDILIQIAADQRKSVWASSVAIKRGRSTRAGGLSPRGGSFHTLLAISLISGLRSVTKGHANRIVRNDSTKKPTLQVMVNDAAFAEAIRSLAAGQKVECFRAGRNFWHDLLKQIRRFTISVHVVPVDDARIGSLKGWAVSTIHASREASDIPAVFQPSAVSVAG